MTSERVAEIRSRLEAAFSPLQLEITDDSHLHAGHVGARSGKGHFSVTIVSASFAGTRTIDRHRMVFEALGDMMRNDIHALSVSASPPETEKQTEPTKDSHEKAVN
ncbi:MAG: BolA family transcriptional regulator [Gammaproteobacteria bacterium]|nr:BolA family transcriptional regulator [Gammaproteobacteria bacterium]MDH3508171.1 BolA family transcriptional regulator [Gammaproteobacteria bacterium]